MSMMRCLAALVALLALPPAARAEDKPAANLTVIVPFPAGSGPDVYARLVTANLAPRIGQTVVIENRAGAGGTIGGRIAARAAPDGNTILLASTGSLLIAPAVAKERPYDPVKGFDPVIMLARGPFILSVRSDLPIHSLKELIAYAQANAGKLNYGTSGFGSMHHLATEMLKREARIDMVHVPFPGSPQSWTALQSGSVDLIFDSMPGPAASLQAEKARAIAVTGSRRLGALASAPMLASVPTFAEQGLAAVDVVFWFGIVAPAGTPPKAIARLNAAIGASLDEPAVKARFDAEGTELAGGTPQAFGEAIEQGAVQWSRLVQQLGLQLQ